jgi:hypothetical protein
MMGRLFVGLGLLGVAGFVAAGVLGYGWFGDEALYLHVVVGLAACLLLLFSQVWIMIYLMGTAREVRRAAQGVEAGAAQAARQWVRQALPAGGVAVIVGLGSFFLGSAVFAGHAPVWSHNLAFYGAVLSQLVALWVEFRLLAASERIIGALDAAAAHAR